MMQGEFMESNQILMELTVRSMTGREEQIEAVLDTGFTGFLVLPSDLVRELELVQLDVNEMVLANGSVARMAVYEVFVSWQDEEHAILAYAGEGDALLGMSLLRGSIGSTEYFPGGMTVIEDAG